VNSFVAVFYRLYPARLIEGNSVRNQLDSALYDPIEDAHVLRKPAAGRLITCRRAHFFVNRTLGVQPAVTVEAIAAGNVVEKDDAIAGNVFSNAIPGSHDDAGGLVAVDAGRREQVVLDFLQIGMTDTTGFDADEKLAGTDGGGFDALDSYSAVADIDGRSHGVRYRLRLPLGDRRPAAD
jgi:hypothetical protein